MGGGKRSKNKKGSNKAEVQAVGNITIKEGDKKGKGDSSKQDSKNAKIINEIVESIKTESSTNAATSLDSDETDEEQQTILRRPKTNRAKIKVRRSVIRIPFINMGFQHQSVPQCNTNAFKNGSTNEVTTLSNETNDVRFETHNKHKEFEEFWRVLKKYPEESFVKVTEMSTDLLRMPERYALAHCVAEDMSMESGIAVQFSQQFKSRDQLYQQKQKQGGLAILMVGNGRFIYYLVTKKLSNGKPTMYTLWCSLKKLQQHMEENKVHQLAIPRIGCEVDELQWSEVKPMIGHVFRNMDVNIIVCNNYQQSNFLFLPISSPTIKRCPVKNVGYSLADIEGGTAIIYLGTEDGHVSEETKNLDEKFNFIRDYKMENKQVGKVLQMYKQYKNYCLYGFIIAKSKRDAFNFVNFQKCVVELKKLNKDFYYVAIEAFLNKDELIMNKIVNLLRYSLYHLEVYVCWPGKMQAFMPDVERKVRRFRPGITIYS